MGAFPDLSVHVVSFDYRPLAGAWVTATSGDAETVSGTADSQGRVSLARNDSSELLVRVEASGLQPEERLVTSEQPQRVELFMLGGPEMPFYYRGTVRVPFEPIENAVGVLLRETGAGDADQPRRIDPEEITRLARTFAERVGASVLRSEGNFARSRITVVGVPDDAVDQDFDTLLERLSASPEVELAGALVKLFAENASFLTNMIVARFADGVGEEDVAAVADRHGLRHEGSFGDLGNIHRLRFGGQATYAVLDACNALVAEPQVLWAEPDLVHTIEDDQVIPTDFLFPEQWDHPIINTPDAWQDLRNADPARTFGSSDVIIAVVDSGVDINHGDFAGTVSSGQQKVFQQFDFTNMVANMNNLAGDHGTCCASACTAQANNASPIAGVNHGVVGIAGNCRLITIRSGGTEARFAEMYLWATGFNANSTTAGFPAQITPGADVITNSFGFSVGSPISGLMSTTFDRLTDDGRGGRGVLLYFSAGNANSDLDVTFARPWGMYDRCFCVAASTLANDGVTEIKAAYSSFGSTVDFCAPSNDNDGVHDPPTAYGAHTATIVANPEGDALPGQPDRATNLSAAAAAGAMTVTVANIAGMAAGQALLLGAPGAGGSEGRLITAINAGANQVTVTPALQNAHGVGTAVVTGPRSHRSNFGGTSYATPVCAGTGALMLSANPRLWWDQVRDIMRNTASRIDPANADPTGRWRDDGGRISTDPGYTGPLVSEFYGFGRIDTAAAVRHAATQIRPGTVIDVAVAPLTDRRLELWAADAAGQLLSTWKTTTNPDANWARWFGFLTYRPGLPANVQRIAMAPLSDGRLESWVATANGGLFSSWKLTTDPNADWAPWFDFLAYRPGLPAGVQEIAMAPLSDGRLQSWAVTAGGGLFTTWKLTTDPNADWSGWADFQAEVGALPGGPRQAGAAPLPDGRLELWVTTGTGPLFSTWKTTTDPDSAWAPWFDFLAYRPGLPAGVQEIAMAPLSDGRLQSWAVTAGGGLFTTWKLTTDPNADWSGWADFQAEVGALPGGAQRVAVAPLPDGRLHLWAATNAGGLFTTWKTTTDPNAAWVPWSDFLAEV